jgi:hypothetical protein
VEDRLANSSVRVTSICGVSILLVLAGCGRLGPLDFYFLILLLHSASNLLQEPSAVASMLLFPL